jgi:hypothetical protein
MHSTVISVPINTTPSQLPVNDAASPPYVIRLVDGSTDTVSPDFLATIVRDYSPTSHKICFSAWLGNSQKVSSFHDGQYLKVSWNGILAIII